MKQALLITVIQSLFFCMGLNYLPAQETAVESFEQSALFNFSQKEKDSLGVEQVEGFEDNAVKFVFKENNKGKFIRLWMGADADRDKYDGFSFYVKGDGSDNFGGIEFIDKQDHSFKYGYIFPLKNTEWHKVVVPWADIVPELPAGKHIDPENGYKPSDLGCFWLGKWFYHHSYPEHSFSLDNLTLIKEIDMKEYPAAEAGIPQTLAKLKARQPVTIVTIGDSLTDPTHWANKDSNWPPILEKKLREHFGYDDITIVNSGLWGNTLNQGSVLLPRDMVPHNPDLVTIFFGFNDWSAGMRGPHFKECMDHTVDRARRLVKGKAEIMLMTTAPGLTRWTTMQELAASVRESARDKKTGLADIEKAFHAVDEQDRASLYVHDKTHLTAPGDNLVAETVFNAIINGAVPLGE